jgi:hypothetical protein
MWRVRFLMIYGKGDPMPFPPPQVRDEDFLCEFTTAGLTSFAVLTGDVAPLLNNSSASEAQVVDVSQDCDFVECFEADSEGRDSISRLEVPGDLYVRGRVTAVDPHGSGIIVCANGLDFLLDSSTSSPAIGMAQPGLRVAFNLRRLTLWL